MAIVNYMHYNKLSTKIIVDFLHEKIQITNYTDDPILRAFGVNENPTYEDFEEFLEERCFPRTRFNMKRNLQALELDSYDPWSIVHKTQGRMADDNMWLDIEDGVHYIIN